VAAPLPETGAATIYHVRLVTENDRGRFAGADRVVVMPQTPDLAAQLRGDRSRPMILARGVRLHVRTTGTRSPSADGCAGAAATRSCCTSGSSS